MDTVRRQISSASEGTKNRPRWSALKNAWRTAQRATTHLLLVLLVAAQTVAFGGARLAQAQTNLPEINIIHTAPGTSGGKNLPLSVFFTLVDEDGKPLADPQVESASIQLSPADGPSTSPVPATVTDPKTPIYVALLIDTSGSMAVEIAPNKTYLDVVIDAAKAAVAQAPSNIYFGVISFDKVDIDQELQPLTNFTNQHSLVADDIGLATSGGNAPTCLYNAAYNTLQMLQEQALNPEDRRAIILFTDGRDEVTGGEPCSQRTLDSVVKLATADPNKTIPIFTVGLMADANPRLQPDVLKQLAVSTNAYSAIGSREEIDGSFQATMKYLSSQRVATAAVRPPKGTVDAILRVKLNGIDEPLKKAFSFDSSEDYTEVEVPVGIQILGAKPCPNPAECWTAQATVSNPGDIDKLRVRVIDTVTKGERFKYLAAPMPNIMLTLDAGQFQDKRAYLLEVCALDPLGNTIVQEQEDSGATGEAKFICDNYPFTQELPQPQPPVGFEILGIKADLAAQDITITLNVTEPERIYDRQLTLLDAEGVPVYTGQRARYISLEGVTAPTIVEPMPATMRTISETRQYTAILDIWTSENIQSRRLVSFSVDPPPAPPWWRGLADNWEVLLALAVLAALLILLIPLWRKPESKPVKNPYGGGEGAETVKPVSLDDNMRLRVKLTRAPQATRALDQLVTKFPCVIGRQDTCDIDLSQITPNRRISRRHLEISVKSGEFYLRDLNSDNGTLLNKKRLQPGVPVRLSETANVRLGPDVILELRPESNHSV